MFPFEVGILEQLDLQKELQQQQELRAAEQQRRLKAEEELHSSKECSEFRALGGWSLEDESVLLLLTDHLNNI